MEVIPLDDRVRSTTVLNTAAPSDFTTVYHDNYDYEIDAAAADALAEDAAANEGMWTRDDASFVVVGASPKAKTMKEVLLRCGRALAVAVVIALAGKGFVARAHNDPLGTDDVMMNVDLDIDSNKQVALLDGDGDGMNVANYDLTKVDGGVSTVRTLEESTSYTFTNVGDGACVDSNNNQFDRITFPGIADVDECKAKCGECPGQGQAAGRELRGIYLFTFSGASDCSCLLDNGGLFDVSVCIGAFDAFSSNSGTGAICNLSFQASTRKCWKVVDSNLKCPGEPTNEPTSSPSMSPTKSPSTAPTASLTAPPSMAPTASPTAPPSKSPTNKPTTLAPTNKPTTASPTSSPTNSKSAKVAKKVKSSKVSEVNQLGAAANMQVQEMKSGGSSFSISRPLVGILALVVFSNLLP
mmetsp:Transcript_29999/g.51243  ORF Transcript_29999/g.51243 Transcript_29999/m.51243 type:complete len:411 (+) Transcript_29999:179-1411(+)